MKANSYFRGLSQSAFATCLLVLGLLAPAAGADNKGGSLTGNYLAGRHAQAQRDLSSAADFLDAALKQAPDAPGLLGRTFIVMTVDGRMKEAVVLARELVKKTPQAVIANLVLAMSDLKKGRFQAAEKRLGKLPGTGIGGFVAPVLRAWALVGEKKYDDALKLIAPKKTESPFKALHALHMGLINELHGNNEKAEKNYLEVNETQNGLSLRVVQLLGAFYERTGRPEKARKLYGRYLVEQPGSQLLDVALGRLKSGKKPGLDVFSVSDGAAEALFGIASALRQQSAGETAMVLSRLALYLKPNFPVMQILLADVLESDNRLEPALKMYSSIDAKSVFSWAARLRMGAVLNKLKRTGEAAEHLKRMAQDRPNDPKPLINLGDILRSHKRYSEAVDAYDDAFKRIHKLEPRHWTLLYARGIALERSGQWTRSEADFLEALEFKPDQPYVLNYLGYSWIEKGSNIKRAQDMIAKAAELRPNDGYIIDSLGWGHFKLGNFEKAVTHLERAVELRPQDPVLNDHLGDAYWRVGRLREARFQWRRSLSLDPEKDVIPKIRQKLKTGLATDTETAKKPPNDG